MTHLCPECGTPTARQWMSGGRWWYCRTCDYEGTYEETPARKEGTMAKTGFFEPLTVYRHIASDGVSIGRPVAEFQCLGTADIEAIGGKTAVGFWRMIHSGSGRMSKWELVEYHDNAWQLHTWVVVGTLPPPAAP